MFTKYTFVHLKQNKYCTFQSIINVYKMCLLYISKYNNKKIEYEQQQLQCASAAEDEDEDEERASSYI